MIDDTGEQVSLNELTGARNKNAPGYQLKRKDVPAEAPRYRLKTQAYLYGRLWPRDSVIPWAGKPGSYMELVEGEPVEPEKPHAGRPRTSKNVI